MNWRNNYYREEANLLGVVGGLMGFNPVNYEPISDEEIEHYIRVARRFRNAFKEEKAQQNGTRSDSECVAAVRLRIQLPKSDEEKFYPGPQCDYLTPERIFLLTCVAVTGSREGARFLTGIALPRRMPKGLLAHINLYLLGSSVSNQ